MLQLILSAAIQVSLESGIGGASIFLEPMNEKLLALYRNDRLFGQHFQEVDSEGKRLFIPKTSLL